ncbi:MAG: OmpH family outer membrane protein, partial [Planctomycetota bacterium]
FQRQRDLLEEINQYRSKLQAEDTRRKQEIDKLQAEVDKLDPEDPTAVQRMRQLLQVNIEYKNWREMKQADTGRELGLWSIRIYNEVARAVEDVARRDGYDFVFYKGQFVPQSMDPEVIKDQIRGNHLLYNHPALEITQAVLDKLNGDYRAQPRQPMLLQTP